MPLPKSWVWAPGLVGVSPPTPRAAEPWGPSAPLSGSRSDPEPWHRPLETPRMPGNCPGCYPAQPRPCLRGGLGLDRGLHLLPRLWPSAAAGGGHSQGGAGTALLAVTPKSHEPVLTRPFSDLQPLGHQGPSRHPPNLRPIPRCLVPVARCTDHEATGAATHVGHVPSSPRLPGTMVRVSPSCFLSPRGRWLVSNLC